MGWKKEEMNNINVILSRILKAANKNDEGKVTYSDIELENYINLLVRFFKFSNEISENVRIQMMIRAIRKSFENSNNLEANSLLAYLRQEIKEYIKCPLKKYIIMTSLSVRYFEGLSSIRLENSHITFSKRCPDRFIIPSTAKNFIKINDLNKFISKSTVVRIAIRSRDKESAIEDGIKQLDLIRAIWNLFYNYNRYKLRIGLSEFKPYNSIVLGPIHTLHYDSGKAAINGFLFEPYHLGARINVKKISTDYQQLKKFEYYIRKKITSSERFKEDKIKFLLLYVNALDQHNSTASLLKLWALLEELTYTEKNESHSKTVKRVLPFTKDINYSKIVLDYIRESRNKIVHEGYEIESFKLDPMVNRLKIYVENLLLFYIENIDKFSSKQDYKYFLDLPIDKNELSKRIDVCKFAIKLRSE